MTLRRASIIGWLRIAAISASFLLPCGLSFVSDLRAANLPNYVFRLWRAEDGLPQNKVSAIQQTRDGYVWIGTYSGLARFDGVSFDVFHDNNTPQMRNSRVTALFEGPDGSLWIGHESGNLTRRWADGRFESVPVPTNEWRAAKIQRIVADGAGEVWILNDHGIVARVSDGLVLSPPAGSVAKLMGMVAFGGGSICIDREGALSVLESGELRPLEFDLITSSSYVQGIGAAAGGGLWVMSDLRMRRWTEQRGLEDIRPAPWETAAVHSVIETGEGVVVAGTADRGLYLVFPDGGHVQFSRTNGFPSDWVTALAEDREGNIWVGTGNNGVAVLHPGMARTKAPPDQWKGRAVLAVTPGRDGSLWVGTEGAGLYRLHDGNWSNYGAEAGFYNPYVWSLGEDVDGELWAGTWFGGLLVRRGEDFVHAIPAEASGGPMLAILPSREGGLWIGTAAGLLRYRNGRTNWIGAAAGAGLRDVNSVVEDRDGSVWFGMASGGLGHLRTNSVRIYNRQDGLSSGSIQCLHLDSDGVLWIGTSGGGLNRFRDGRFAAIGKEQGLANPVICNVQDDGRGYFWLSSHGGIMRVSKAELNACADGLQSRVRVLHLGLHDGLPTLECTGGLQPAGCRTPDGDIWFPTTKGLVSIDPRDIRTNPLPPPVVIEELRVDGETLPLPPDGIQVKPGRHHFEFRYTGLSFVAPERVRFKCRLDDLDQQWEDNGHLRSMVYNYIPPGRYTFRVIAANNDGVWNERGAQLEFEVLPFFWQTVWFRSLAAVLVVGVASGGVWYAMRRRMRAKLERLERQRTLERERARIARDIHDDLGASLTRITMLSQVSPAVRTQHVPPSPAIQNLDQIFGTARELTRAMDEIVWAVNPSHDTLDSLANYLGKFSQDYLRAAGVRCRLDVPLHLPALAITAEVRHNLFLAFKEALNNVVKHARASEARITLTLSEREMIWQLEDNGRGFNPEQVAAAVDPDRTSGGNGLPNMSRRLAETGGECEIRSSQGLGTQVRFRIPLPAPVRP